MANFPTHTVGKGRRPRFYSFTQSLYHENDAAKERERERQIGRGRNFPLGGKLKVRGPQGGIVDKRVLIASSRVNQVNTVSSNSSSRVVLVRAFWRI